MDLGTQAASIVSRGCFVKKWPQRFFDSQKPRDTGPFIDTLRLAGASNDSVELFMQQYSGGTANICFETVTRFCKNVTVEDFNNQHLSKRGTAWLDDRSTTPSSLELNAHDFYDGVSSSETSIPTSKSSEESDPQASIEESGCDIADARTTIAISPISRAVLQPRENPDNLTARDLYRLLREKQLNHAYLEDAARRLIYITDPDDCDILALIETAREDQKNALCDILWQYIERQTSFKVKISRLTGGYRVFQLELHIPYFAALRTPLEELQNDMRKKTNPDWVNLSFLDDHGQNDVLGMHEAQFSLTICGSNNSHWVVFCLEETKFDEDREVSEYDRGSGWRMDQISMTELEATLPLRDPREYFLRIWRIKLVHAVKQMQGLVVRAETSLARKTSVSASASMTPEWIEAMLKLGDHCIHNISKLSDQWKAFQSNSGDIGYFDDTTATASPALRARLLDGLAVLNEKFVEMQCFEKRFRYVQERCVGLRNNLEYRLVRHSSQVGQITLLLISPIITMASIFAIPTKVVPFRINTLSFALSIGIFMLFQYACFSLIGGGLGRQVWMQRLKDLKRGDPTITVKKESGATVLRRRIFTRNSAHA